MLWASGPFLIGAIALFTVVGLLALLLLPRELVAWWVPNGVTWDEATTKAVLTAAVQAVLFTLGGFIAIVGVGVSLSRHGQEIRAGERQGDAHQLDIETRIRDRLASAVEMLSDADSALRRTAGVYALSAIADEWIARERKDEAQICVDILCAYLRSAPSESGAPTSPEEVGVRTAGFAAIRARLLPAEEAPHGGKERWHGLNLDLSRARIEFDVNLSRVVLRDTRLQMSRVQVLGGRLRMENVAVPAGGEVRLERATFSDGGRLDLSGARLSDLGFIDLTRASFSGASMLVVDRMSLDGKARLIMTRLSLSERSSVRGSECLVTGGAHIIFTNASFDGGSALTLDQLRVNGAGSSVSAVRASFCKSLGQLDHAKLSDGGLIVMRGIAVSERAGVGFHSLSIVGQSQLQVHSAMISTRSHVRCVGATVADGSVMDFERSYLSDSSELVLSHSSVTQSRLILNKVQVRSGSRVLLNGVDVTRGTLDEEGVEVDPDGRWVR